MDGVFTLGIAVLAGGAFVVSGVVALVTMLAFRRVPRSSGGIALGSILLCAAALLATPPGYDSAELARIERLRAGFAPALEGYRARHGQYPRRLETVGIPTPDSRYGPVQYSTFVDEQGRPGYSLSVGDYDVNGFAGVWDTRRPPGDWSVDM